MIKIAHFISPRGIYGAERQVLGLLSQLDKSRINPLLIVPTFSDTSLIKEAEKLNIESRIVPLKSKFSILDGANKLAGILKDEKIDILHTHGYKSDMIGLLAARRAGIRILSTAHGWSHNARLKLRVYELADQAVLHFFDFVTSVSSALCDSLFLVNKKKKKTIKNFINLEILPCKKKGNPKLITYLGRLIEGKRVQDLMIALKYLPKNINLQIIGDGPKKGGLVRLAKKLKLSNRVKFLGFRSDRLNLLNNSKILVLPSLSEGIPRGVMEAMAMGKSVIATDIPGVRDVIKHKETGLLVPVKNPRKIAEAINYFLRNKKHAKEMGRNARNLIEKDFTAERAVKEYITLYNQLYQM